RRWKSPWPPPQGDLTVPVTLSGVPPRWWGPTGPLEHWQATTAAGERSVRVVQPDWVNVHCNRDVALRTDYRPALTPPPPASQPYPKDGIVVSPPHAVESIDILSSTSDELRALLPVVHTSFNTAERQTADRHGHPIERRAREGVQPTIEAVYA